MRALPLLLVIAAAAACAPPLAGRGCSEDGECRAGFVCDPLGRTCVPDASRDGGPGPLEDGGPPPPPVDGGDPPPPDAGVLPPLGPPALYALSSELQSEGERLHIEGVFDGQTIVHFPDGTNAVPDRVGRARLSVTVPEGAGAGLLEVTTGGQRVGALPFRAVRAPIELGPPSAALQQNQLGLQTHPLAAAVTGGAAFGGERAVCLAGGDDGALRTAVECQSVDRAGEALGAAGARAPLASARADAAITRLADGVLVIGGRDGAGESAEVEHIVVGADGEPGAHTLVGTLALARAGATAHVIGRNLFVVGGVSAGVRLDSVERAVLDKDGVPGPFSVVAQLQATRAHHAAAVLGDRLYLLGGEGDGVELSSIESAPIDDDGELGPFTLDAATLPDPRARAGALQIGDQLYLFGGVSVGNLSDEVVRFDGTAAANTGLTLLRPRRDVAVARAANHALILGGVDDGGPTDLVERAYLLGGEPAFEPITGATFAEGRYLTTYAASGDTIYVLGGARDVVDNNGNLTDQSSLREVSSATLDDEGLTPFAAEAQQLVSRRSGAAAFVANGFLYVAGGFQFANQVGGPVTTLDTVERAAINADGSLGDFEDLGGLLTEPRDSICAIILGDQVYLMGGFDNLSPTTSIQQATLNPDGSLTDFQVATSQLTLPRDGGQSCAVIGNHVYVVGGAVFDRVVNDFPVYLTSDTVERAVITADGQLGPFLDVGDLSTPREGPVLTSAGDRLLILGGGAYVGNDETQFYNSTNSVEASPVVGAPSFSALPGTLNAARTGGFLIRTPRGPLVGGGFVFAGEFVTTVELGLFR